MKPGAIKLHLANRYGEEVKIKPIRQGMANRPLYV
jgi:hypothetical protein